MINNALEACNPVEKGGFPMNSSSKTLLYAIVHGWKKREGCYHSKKEDQISCFCIHHMHKNACMHACKMYFCGYNSILNVAHCSIKLCLRKHIQNFLDGSLKLIL